MISVDKGTGLISLCLDVLSPMEVFSQLTKVLGTGDSLMGVAGGKCTGSNRIPLLDPSVSPVRM